LGGPRTVQVNFEYPLIVSVGVAYDGIENLLLACDVRDFDYGNADGFKQVGFDSSGALRGLGWRSILAVASGAQYKLDENLFARVGYSFNQNPISDFASGFNIASPVISQHFVYVGGSYQFSSHSILSITYVHAFENEVRGPVQSPLGPVPGTSVASTVALDVIAAGITVRY
jgi:long-chain fatty acid transport protein